MGYGWYAYEGLYLLFAEWQLATFDTYYSYPTALVPGVVLALPALQLLKWLNRRAGQAAAAPRSPGRNLLLTAIVGVVALLMAAGAYTIGQREEARVRTVATLDLRQTMTPPAAERLVVIGLAHPDLTTSLETTMRSSTRTEYYVPLTAPDWQPDQPLVYFLKTEQNAFIEPGTRRIHSLTSDHEPFALTTGPAYIESHMLPGPLREEYRRAGLVLGPRLHILNQQTSSAFHLYWAAALIGGIIGVACVAGAGAAALNLWLRKR
jgi:hypothetical protein